MKVLLPALAVLVIGFVGAWRFWPRGGRDLPAAPTSVKDALLAINDVPADMLVVSPPTANILLGRRVESQDLGARTGIIDAAPCYLVHRPERSASLGDIAIKFKSAEALRAGLKDVMAKVSVDERSDVQATLSLRGLEIVEGFGIPLPNTPCWEDRRPGDVVTQVLRAKEVSLVFSGSIKLSVGADDALGSGSTLGWSGDRAAEGILKGSDITLLYRAARFDKVVARGEPIDLGSTVEPRVIPFPDGFEGKVVVVDYDHSAGPAQTGVLTVRLEAPFAEEVDPEPPKSNVRLCPAGEELALELGQICMVASRSIAVGATWRTEPVAGVNHIIVDIFGYKGVRATPTEAATEAAPHSSSRPKK